MIQDKVTLAAVCMSAAHDKGKNLKKYARYIESASKAGVDLLAFPEASLQGYTWTWNFKRSVYKRDKEQQEYFESNAETVPGPSTELISELARKHDMYIVIGMAEKAKMHRKPVIYNSAVLVGPRHLLGVHRKIHQAPNPIFTEGCGFSAFQTRIGKIGLVICADMLYLESVRSLALQGAEVVVNSTAWGLKNERPNIRTDPAGYDYDLITRATARLNKVWLVSADQVGAAPKSKEKCYGHSRIVDPQGKVVVDSGYREGMVVAEVDVREETGPDRFKGRRPECYYPLTK